MTKYLTLIASCFILLSANSQGVTMKPDKFEKRKLNSKAVASLKKGIAFYNSKDLVGAKKSFRKAIKIDSKFTEAHLNLARILDKQDSTDQALASYNNAVNSNATAPRAFYDRGKFFLRTGKYGEARRDLKSATSLYNKNPLYNYYYGVSLYKTNNFEKALEQFNIVLDKNNDHAHALNDRGATYIQLGRYEEARTDIEKALSIKPNFNMAETNLGKIENISGNYDKAIKHFNKVLESDSKSVAAINGIGIAQMKQGKFEEAESSFNKAKSLNPNSPSSLINLSSLALVKEEYKEAIDFCNQAITMDGNSKEAYYNRGIAKEMNRDEAGACSDWEIAFSLGSVEAENYLNSAVCNQ